MPGDYSTRFGLRPCPSSSEADTTTARFFLCAGCRAQVFVCRRCDRGQIYCAGACAQEARQRSQQEAGRRYQATSPGRMKRAARNRLYRARMKIVTHQSSPPQPRNDVVPPDAVPFAAAVTASKPAAVREVVMQSRPPNRDSCTATGAESAVRRCSATSSCVAANEVQAMTENKGNTMPSLLILRRRFYAITMSRNGGPALSRGNCVCTTTQCCRCCYRPVCRGTGH